MPSRIKRKKSIWPMAFSPTSHQTSEDISGSRNFKSLLAFLCLSAVQAFLAVFTLALQPADPKNAFLFGFSKNRLAMLSCLLLYGLVAVVLLLWGRRKQSTVTRWVHAFKGRRLLYGIVLLLSLAAAETVRRILAVPPSRFNSYQYSRLLPLLIWSGLVALQAFLLLLFWIRRGLAERFKTFHLKTYRAPFQARVPELSHRLLNQIVLLIFLLALVVKFPGLISTAQQADERYHGTIATIGDDWGYQTLAVNLMNGYGYADHICQPLEVYHLDLTSEPGKEIERGYDPQNIPPPYATYYRAPGLSLLLSAVYTIFGSQTIVARIMMAVLFWLSMVCLLLLGWLLAGWLGGLAGGLVALATMGYSPMILDFERVLTEIPALFWITLFALLFVVHQKRGNYLALASSSLALGMAALTRSNFLTVLPLMVIYLLVKKVGVRKILLFFAVGLVPLMLWAGYASSSAGRPVFMPAQGASDFPAFNNIDVLEGIGEDHLLQGEWNPGFVLDENGELVLPSPYRNTAKKGENGYVKGLTFWLDNWTQLPRFFYVKMWKNFWYDGYDHGYARHYPVGINLVAIGFLLLGISVRPGSSPFRRLRQVKWSRIIPLGLLLLAFLALRWHHLPFWGILILWALMAILALLFPRGTAEIISDVRLPDWFFCLIASHLMTTLLYGGWRFHFPLDPMLTMFGVLGVLLVIYYGLKKDLLLAAGGVLCVIACWI